jgi:ribosomal protein S18
MGVNMTDARADGPSFYGVPFVVWITVLVAVLSAGAAVFVAWRLNANSRRNLDEQLARSWQQVVRQLKHEAEQRIKQRAHDAEQLTRQLAHDAEQLTRQLAHDAEQRDRERKVSLRREVYLEAAAALTNLLTLVGRAASIEYDETAMLDEFVSNQARLAKVHIVGTEATVDAVMTYMNELTPAFLELITRRVPLLNRKHTIDTHVDRMNNAGVERERCEALMQRLNAEGMRESQRWQVADAHYKFASEQFASQQSTTMKLQAEQMEEQMETGRRSVNLVAQIARLLPGAMAAVRGEMELPLDRRRYEQLWNVQISKVDYTWKQAMERIRSTSSQFPPHKSE